MDKNNYTIVKSSKRIVFFLFFLVLLSCTEEGVNQPKPEKEKSLELAKFEEETCLLFVGQDLESVGGSKAYSEGYCDSFTIPDGITTYTGIRDLPGLDKIADWGAGPIHADKILNDSNFNHCVISIGLSMVGTVDEINNGQLNHSILEFGNWLKENSNRNFFLRIGYEFDGVEWNFYEKLGYISAWKRIVNQFKSMGVNNVAYVWQSKGYGTSLNELEEWYPGDSYVDWCSYSYFSNPDENMIEFARKHKKPVFIAEATPIYFKDNKLQPVNFKDEQCCRLMWDQWFNPLFETIERNSDVVKALAYINCNWTSQPMWQGNPMFHHIDSRLQLNDWISVKWNESISSYPFTKKKQ